LRKLRYLDYCEIVGKDKGGKTNNGPKGSGWKKSRLMLPLSPESGMERR
jgi:hypothetical protein